MSDLTGVFGDPSRRQWLAGIAVGEAIPEGKGRMAGKESEQFATDIAGSAKDRGLDHFGFMQRSQ